MLNCRQLGKLRATSCMPAFLLGVSGPNITVSGAIYVEGVITERLTDIISLVPVLSSQEPLGRPSARDQLAYRIAHLFICLRECLDQLADEYTNTSSLPAADDFTLVPCPHFSSLTTSIINSSTAIPSLQVAVSEQCSSLRRNHPASC